MDNLSHALAGMAAAAVLHRVLPAEIASHAHSARHRMLLVAGALSANFPDLDLVLTGLNVAPLGYLLHHRGHTHTILYAIPQALLLMALIWLLWPSARALLRSSSHARWGLVGMMGLGFGLHLGMDFFNSYGIHPFYPFDARWFYGDMVFIIEPAFWVALGVPLISAIAPRWLRVALLLLLASMLAYFAAMQYLHWMSFVALYVLGAVLLTLARGGRDSAGRATLAGIAVFFAFPVLQWVAAQQLVRDVNQALHSSVGVGTLHDIAKSAFASNPLCWNFVTIETDEAADMLRLHRGVASIAPELLPAQACPPLLVSAPVQANAHPNVAIAETFEAPLSAFLDLYQSNCHFEAWLRFARMPHLAQGVASDWRFASSQRGNFTTMDLGQFEGGECPRNVPQWAFPRGDVLKGE